MTKKCAKCSFENEATVMYCRRCGHFLMARVIEQDINPTSIFALNDPCSAVSGGGDVVFPVNFGDPTVSQRGVQGRTADPVQQMVMICPICRTEHSMRSGRPLSCSVCGYFFQPGDQPTVKVQPSAAGGGQGGAGAAGRIPSENGAAGTVPSGDPSGGLNRRTGHGPMRRGGGNQTELRLIGNTVNGSFILPVKPEGGTLGTEGTLRPDLIRSMKFRGMERKHLKIWREDTGWYLLALSGMTLLQGGLLQVGASVTLENGNSIIAGKDCDIRVEITNPMMG